jgi:hypothetical protein
VDAWIDRHGRSRFAGIASELLNLMADVESASELFDALAGYYRST